MSLEELLCRMIYRAAMDSSIFDVKFNTITANEVKLRQATWQLEDYIVALSMIPSTNG